MYGIALSRWCFGSPSPSAFFFSAAYSLSVELINIDYHHWFFFFFSPYLKHNVETEVSGDLKTIGGIEDFHKKTEKNAV